MAMLLLMFLPLLCTLTSRSCRISTSTMVGNVSTEHCVVLTRYQGQDEHAQACSQQCPEYRCTCEEACPEFDTQAALERKTNEALKLRHTFVQMRMLRHLMVWVPLLLTRMQLYKPLSACLADLLSDELNFQNLTSLAGRFRNAGRRQLGRFTHEARHAVLKGLQPCGVV